MKAILIALAISTIVCFASAGCNSTVSAAGCASCADSISLTSGLNASVPSTLQATLQGICTTCNSGFYFTPVTACTGCSANCLLCTNATNCLTCNSTGFYLVSGVCQSCSNTTAANGVTGVAGCITCSAPSGNGTVNCTACNQAIGYLSAPASNVCAFCPISVSGTNYTVTNCAGCGNTTATKGFCTICPSGLTLPSVGAITAAQACVATNQIANCLQLNTASPQTCLTCNEGYWLNGTTCTACPAGCKTCTSQYACTACLSGYGLATSPASPNVDTCISCSAGGVTGATGQFNITGVPGCTACNFTAGANGTVACSACNTTLTPSSNVCASNTTSCYTGCATCTTAQSNTTCTSCMTGYILLNNGSCVLGTAATGCLISQNMYTNASTQCIVCNMGYLATVPTCTACGSNCAQCTSATACTTCAANSTAGNFTLTNGACVNASANNTSKSSNILLPGMALLSMIFYYLF